MSENVNVSRFPSADARTYVVEGATLRCTLGTALSRLAIPVSHGVYINGKKAANVADHVGGHNILTFVNCMRSWPPPPCTYPTINKWVNGKENTWIDGEHQLLNVSVNFCMFGGVISVVNDGQGQAGMELRKKTVFGGGQSSGGIGSSKPRPQGGGGKGNSGASFKKPEPNIEKPRDINDIWDHHTINRLKALHPNIQDAAVAFILDAQSKGIYLRVTSGFRSFAEQDALFAQGRTTSGSIVTNARGGQSYHNYGLAIDVVEFRDGIATTENMLFVNDRWDEIGAIGKSHGFEWGGDWAGFPDRPHFQKTFGFTTAELGERQNQGLVDNGFVQLD